MLENETGKLHILIVEDHRQISDMLADFLIEHGYEISSALDGKTASSLLTKNSYDLILMDLMLPYKSGEELIRELRTHADTPVICLSAKSQMETRIDVLRMGADDYLLKPFDLNEVLVRIEVVLRRSGAFTKNQKTETCLSAGKLRLYPEENCVLYQEKLISLTSKELKILTLFLQNPQKTFTKANLYESVWNDEYYYEDNTINVHVSNLRAKLKKATGNDYIETVWGIGYRLKEDVL